MMESLKSMFATVFYSPVSQISTVSSQVTGNNPFANPFVTTSSATYAKNNPVKGGYFAGYYNNKPNIVGRRLFVEV